MNCCFFPETTEAVRGTTWMDCRIGGVTVRTAEPLMEPEAAMMFEVPTARVEARPEAETVAVARVAEDQVRPVRACCDLSVKTPTAANCCVEPKGIDAVAGVTLMDASTGAVTEKVADP